MQFKEKITVSLSVIIVAMLMGLPLYVMYTSADVSNEIPNNSVITFEKSIDPKTISVRFEEDTSTMMLLSELFPLDWSNIIYAKPDNIAVQINDNSLVITPNQDWNGHETVYIGASYNIIEPLPIPPTPPSPPPVTFPDSISSTPGNDALKSDDSEIPFVPIYIPMMIEVDVTPVNDPPIAINIAPQVFEMTTDTVFSDVPNYMNLDDMFYDIDSDLTYSILNINSDISVKMVDNSLDSIESMGAVGSSSFTVFASDGEYEEKLAVLVNVVPRDSFDMLEDTVSEENILSFTENSDVYEIIDSEHIETFLTETPLEDSTVEIVPDDDWFGTESISFMTYTEPLLPIFPWDPPITFPQYASNVAEVYGCYDWDIDVENVNDPPTVDSSVFVELEMTSRTDFDMAEPLALSSLFNDIDSELTYYCASDNGLVDASIRDGFLTSTSTSFGTGTDVLTIVGSDGEFMTEYNIPVNVRSREAINMVEDITQNVEFSSFVNTDMQNFNMISSEHIDVIEILHASETLAPADNWYGSESIALNAYPVINSIQPPTTTPITFSVIPGPVLDPPMPYTMEYTCLEFDIEVASVNDAPVMDSIPSQVLFEDEYMDNAFNVLDYFEDVDSVLDFSVISSGTNIQPLLSDGGTMRIDPVDDWYGTESLIVSATDGEYSIMQEVGIQVLPVNDAPFMVAEVEILEIDEDTNVIVELDDYISDIDDGLWYSVICSDESASIVVNETTWTASITPANDWNGVLDLTVYGSDDEYELARNLTLTVRAINDTPVTVSNVDLEMQEDSSVTIDLSEMFSDVDSELNFIAYSPTSGLRSTLSDSLLQISTTQDNWNGDETIRIVASDGEYTLTEDVMVSVSPVNDAPVNNMNDLNLIMDEDNSFALWASDMFMDIDGDALEYQFEASDELDLQFNLASNSLKIVPSANWNGDASIQAIASDGELTTSIDIAVQVNSVNDKPFISESLRPIILRSGDTFTVDVSQYFSDVDSTALSFEILEEEGVTVTSTDVSGVYSITVPNDWEGTKTLTVLASDGAETIETQMTLSASMPEMVVASSGAQDFGSIQPVLWVGIAVMVSVALLAVYNGRKTDHGNIRDQIL